MSESCEPDSASIRDIFLAIIPVLLLSLNILIFGTFTVFNENQGEFLFPFTDALYQYYLPAVVLLVAIGSFPLALSRRVNRNYNAIIILLGVLTYIHGNLLLWDTGILDGSQLDLSSTRRSMTDALLWLTLTWLAFRYRNWLAVQGWKICLLLMVFQLIGAISIYAGKNQSQTADMSVFPQELAEFSADLNVIHIVLDGFQANIFAQLLAEVPGLANDFEGFIFFSDATTVSDVTYLSVPASLTGIAFKNEQPISQYLESTLQGDNLYSFLDGHGFNIDVATPLWWNQPRPFFTSYFRIPRPYSNKRELLFSSTLLLVDISLYRAMPHFLKHVIYKSGAWLLSGSLVSDPAQQFEHFAHNAFIADLQNRMSVSSSKPRYKFIHLVTPHAPMVTMENCDFSGAILKYTEEAFSRQSLCTLKTIAAFLDKLKSYGIYDNSMLIIHGDHGGGVPFDMVLENGESVKSTDVLHRIWGNPVPMVLIKPPHSTGNIQISEKQVQLLDLPVTIASQLGFDSDYPGRSMLKQGAEIDIDRFYFHSTMHRNKAAAKDSFDEMTSYKITGSVYQLASWAEMGSYFAPVLDGAGSYLWNTTISFGKRGNSRFFQSDGWAITTAQRIVWTEGSEAILSIGFPETEGQVRLRAKLKPLLAPGKLDSQRVEIYVGGKQAGTWNISSDSFHNVELVIPGEFFNQAEMTEIKFILPDARSPESLGTGRDKRNLALAFYSIEFTQVSARIIENSE